MYDLLIDPIERNDKGGVIALVAAHGCLDEALVVACGAGNYELAELLLRMGADPNAPEPWNERTGFLEACSIWHDKLVRLLLEHGGEPNRTDGYGSDGMSSVFGNLRLERLMIEHGYLGAPSRSNSWLQVERGLSSFPEPITSLDRDELADPEPHTHSPRPPPLRLDLYVDRNLPLSGEVSVRVLSPSGQALCEIAIDLANPPPVSPFSRDLSPTEPGLYLLELRLERFTGRMSVKLHWVVEHESYAFFSQWHLPIRPWPRPELRDYSQLPDFMPTSEIEKELVELMPLAERGVEPGELVAAAMELVTRAAQNAEPLTPSVLQPLDKWLRRIWFAYHEDEAVADVLLSIALNLPAPVLRRAIERTRACASDRTRAMIDQALAELHVPIQRPQSPADWLVHLEILFRDVALLDSAYRFTQADVDLVTQVLDGRLDIDVLSLGTRWLHDRAHELSDQGNHEAIDLIARLDGGGVARWEHEGYADWAALLPRLAILSRGALPLQSISTTWIEAPRDCDFQEVSCVLGGERRYFYLPDSKYGHNHELLLVLNSWILESGRHFGMLGDHFVCVTDEVQATLAQHGLEPVVPHVWERDPVEFTPLLEHLWEQKDYARMLDVTTFSPMLIERTPMPFYRGLAHLALGNEAEGWAALSRAAKLGDSDAMERVKARLAMLNEGTLP